MSREEVGRSEGRPSPSGVTLVGIYRRRNASLVEDLVEPARSAGWELAWWALDSEATALTDVTVGAGAGPKLRLLNEVVMRAGIDKGWLVVADDDVSFARGNVVELVALCARARLDLAQPARSDDNSRHEFNVAHPITAARTLSRVRTTSFVEVGPLFVVGPSWWKRIVPFPDERGMGWGLELDWYELHQQGCRLGIVDAVRVEHRGEPGSDYDFEQHVERVHDELAQRGYAGWKDVQRTMAVWRPWQRDPPWARSNGVEAC